MWPPNPHTFTTYTVFTVNDSNLLLNVIMYGPLTLDLIKIFDGLLVLQSCIRL